VATLIIGDARATVLQQYQNRSNNILFDYTYLLEDSAEYSWFNSYALSQLPLTSSEIENVVVMLGFNDCIYSCIWDSFDIEQIAREYSVAINRVQENYSSINFYICSVGPTDADCAFAEYSNGLIPKETLNNKIQEFNNKLKQSCTAAFIDCHDYLIRTGFSTRDGIRYNSEEVAALLTYIYSNLKTSAENSFIPRLTAPIVSDADVESDLYWLGDSYEGYNPFDGFGQKYAKCPGDTLPNCTAYAWGRFYEITGERPKLSTRNAEQWFLNTSDGYKRGQTPELGAVICWQAGATTDRNGDDGAGHVAIVEQINDDGSIVTSESGWESSKYWWTTKRTNSNGNWGAGSNYTFQGFIYCPAVTPTASNTDLDKTAVTAKNEALTKTEMKANAKYIWNYLGSRGWSLNAVAGMLGNMQHESTINPGRQQVNGSGFGLVQWTPKTNLTDWTSANGYAEDDIDGQLEKIINEKDTGKQYYRNHYKYNFKEFSTSLDSPYTLACAFAFDYERSAVVLWGASSKAAADKLTEVEKEANREALRQRRGKAAEEWYKFLAPFVTSSTTEERFIFEGIRVGRIGATTAIGSLILKNSESCRYTLSSSSDNRQAIVQINPNETLQVFNLTNLVPNTYYTLTVEAINKTGENTLVKTTTFSTPPTAISVPKMITLACNDDVKTIDSAFTLKVAPSNIVNYWKQNGQGCELVLIVNNKEESVKMLESTTIKSFKIFADFGYKCKADDVIQIGLRPTTFDIAGKKVYSQLTMKTSEPICLLNNSIQAYLNI
jgi:surface antigen